MVASEWSVYCVLWQMAGNTALIPKKIKKLKWKWRVRSSTHFSSGLLRVDSRGVASVFLHPSLDFQFVLASAHPVLYRPFEVFKRWCLLVSPRDHLWCHPYLCLRLLVVILSLQRPGFSPICDGHSNTQIGHYNSSNGLYLFVHPLIHLVIPSSICSFIFLSPIVYCHGSQWLRHTPGAFSPWHGTVHIDVF